MRHDHKPTSFEMMHYLNGFSILPLLLLTCGASVFYRPEPVYVYLLANPSKFTHILEYGFASAIGQIFIFRAMITFGTLTLSVITTTRKFFTVFLSILMFKHVLSPGQWACVALVLAGSSLDGAAKYVVPSSKEKK